MAVPLDSQTSPTPHPINQGGQSATGYDRTPPDDLHVKLAQRPTTRLRHHHRPVRAALAPQQNRQLIVIGELRKRLQHAAEAPAKSVAVASQHTLRDLLAAMQTCHRIKFAQKFMADGEGRGHAAILILNFLAAHFQIICMPSDRRRQPSVPRAKPLRVIEVQAVAHPNDVDALRNMV